MLTKPECLHFESSFLWCSRLTLKFYRRGSSPNVTVSSTSWNGGERKRRTDDLTIVACAPLATSRSCGPCGCNTTTTTTTKRNGAELSSTHTVDGPLFI
ncbi:hypothetical protein BDZ89DRAFT_1062232 [Hymenopellis radicata]|nr:hypothetical protein BDZ89DRAFT_1062232 [Hymenopellis radicata]